MFQEKSETEDKEQGGTSDSSTNTQEKGVEFSESCKRPDGSEKDPSNSDGDKQEATQEKPKPLSQSVRVTVPLTRYGWEDDHVSFTLVKETCDPGSYRKAIEEDDHGKWITTMEQQMESLDRNQTWTLVDLPKDSKTIAADGSQQYKARLIVKRNAQKEDIDYNEIFSPVVKHTFI